LIVFTDTYSSRAISRLLARDAGELENHPDCVIPVHPAASDTASGRRCGGDERLTQVTNTDEKPGWGEAPAALLLRRARDEIDTALAHIADTPLRSQVRDELAREIAALVVRLERVQSLLSREGCLRVMPASNPAGS
jgi:hypothetical protein